MEKYLLQILFWFVCSATYAYGQSAAEEPSCLDCHKNIMANQLVHPPAEEACDYCHESIGNEHPNENEKGFKLSEEMPGLCYICHEEPQSKHIHAAVEEGECMICHSPHSSSFPSLLKENPPSKLCFECHDEDIAANKYNHQPVKEGNCQNCHDPHQSDEPSLLKSKLPALCFSCHENTGKEMETKHLHPPFEDDCRNCHQVHGSTQQYLLDEKVPALCFDCHDDIKENTETFASVHHVVTDKKACSNCHSPHASSTDKFLLSEPTKLCLSCHNKTILTEDKKLSNIRQKVINSKVVHGAIEFDGCAGCHLPHTSKYTPLLIDIFPASSYTRAQADSFAICFTCHDPELMETKETKTATNFRNETQNLHYLHINGDKGRSCSNCHDMHGSSWDHLIKDKIRFGRWDMPLIYRVTENGGSCMTGCHSEKKYDRNKFIDNAVVSIATPVTKIEKYVSNEVKGSEVDSLDTKLVASTKNIEFDQLQVEFEKIQLPSIQFGLNGTGIVEGTDTELIYLINFMKDNPGCRLLIEGHTDNDGEKIYDMALSVKRAERIKKRMVSFGIDANRIDTVGYGKTKPVASNKSKSGQEKNRRVEFKLTQ